MNSAQIRYYSIEGLLMKKSAFVLGVLLTFSGTSAHAADPFAYCRAMIEKARGLMGNMPGEKLVSIDEKKGIEVDRGTFSRNISSLEKEGVKLKQEENYVEFSSIRSDKSTFSTQKKPDGTYKIQAWTGDSFYNKDFTILAEFRNGKCVPYSVKFESRGKEARFHHSMEGSLDACRKTGDRDACGVVFSEVMAPMSKDPSLFPEKKNLEPSTKEVNYGAE